jgi:hypothetical protein
MHASYRSVASRLLLTKLIVIMNIKINCQQVSQKYFPIDPILKIYTRCLVHGVIYIDPNFRSYE